MLDVCSKMGSTELVCMVVVRMAVVRMVNTSTHQQLRGPGGRESKEESRKNGGSQSTVSQATTARRIWYTMQQATSNIFSTGWGRVQIFRGQCIVLYGQLYSAVYRGWRWPKALKNFQDITCQNGALLICSI